MLTNQRLFAQSFNNKNICVYERCGLLLADTDESARSAPYYHNYRHKGESLLELSE